MLNRLEIAVIRRSGGESKHERQSIDFLVDGVSLFETCKAMQLDFCGRFSSDQNHEMNERIRQAFSGECHGDTATGRLMLFVCPECSDLGCGAITFILSIHDEEATWSAFAYENNYDSAMTDFDSYAAIGPFTFRRQEYLAILAKASCT